MPFLNLDDNFPDHPKVDVLSDAAFRLHVSGMCYAARHLTDGDVPALKVARLVPIYEPEALEELMHGRLWLPADSGYSIHDYLDWNRSRQEITETKERIHKARSEAGRKGAAARWGK